VAASHLPHDGQQEGRLRSPAHRTLEVTYKTAWFLAHRIREAMRDGELAPFGGAGGMWRSDETFIGQNPDAPKSKMAIRNMKTS
jgi:hypothetical protein